jgi:voltage-gated potassium channel
MMRISWHSLFGLEGVSPLERPAARYWGKVLEAPMLLVAFWILVEWYLNAKGLSSPQLNHATNLVVWIAFVFETVLLTLLVQNKLDYLVGNWLNLVIIVLGIPVIWGLFPHVGILRSLRLLIVLGLLINLSHNVRRILSSNHLGSTLLLSFVFVSIAGVLMAGLDPAIKTPWDGIWWAWVTVTTVGYGDVVPTSVAGKLLASILMLLGLGLFSLLTATISVFFISRSEEGIEEEIEEKEVETMKKLDGIEKRLDEMADSIERLHSKKD